MESSVHVHEHSSRGGGKPSRAKKTVTQKDIARALGISRGTVDRALHGRAGISTAVKERILSTAKSLGYAPNKFAQLLVTGKKITIAMITPSDPFWVRVHEGANSYLSELGEWLLRVTWYETTVHDPEREVALFQEALEARVDGIGIAPSDPDLLTPWIDRAVRSGIPVVTLNTDAPESDRIVFIGQDSAVAGRVAAELLAKFLLGRGRVAIIAGFKNVLVHKLRMDAFRDAIAKDYAGVAIGEIYESHDSDSEPYEIARAIFRAGIAVDGIYLTTGTGIGALGRALKEIGVAGTVKVVCFDFLADTLELLKDGTVSASIGEDPYSQGYQSVKALYNYITDRRRPDGPALYTRMDIGLRANIDLLGY